MPVVAVTKTRLCCSRKTLTIPRRRTDLPVPEGQEDDGEPAQVRGSVRARLLACANAGGRAKTYLPIP